MSSLDRLKVSQLSTHQMTRAITTACGNPDVCNEANLLIRLRNGSNIAIISTPSMETANVAQSVPRVRFGAKDYAGTAYVAAPDNSCKGVIHRLDAGTTLAELLAHLRPPVGEAQDFFLVTEKEKLNRPTVNHDVNAFLRA
ncbi:hypothetical protein HPB49_012291 [Dermacentor silvarum]|uniref:Uncharacterized protein n=1 Tax=Dermacentor silvarum TaxID=543639 RepID=A0ACB8D547_DERSI|nr:hypothetical protein HPB49_012291 [Dermacentor silvarum]